MKRTLHLSCLFAVLTLAASAVAQESAEFLDLHEVAHANYFDFLLGSWEYEFQGGGGSIHYEAALDDAAIRGTLEGSINGTRFAGGSLTFPDADGVTWHRRWIDTLGNTLVGRVSLEAYPESELPSLVSRFEHGGRQMMHVWYSIGADRFETDLLVQAEDGEGFQVVRRMPYIRVP